MLITKLNEIRLKKGLTYREIGESIGLSEIQVSHLFSEQRFLHLEKIQEFVLGFEGLPEYFRIQKLPSRKTLDTLLMEGFSYWEAIRILN